MGVRHCKKQSTFDCALCFQVPLQYEDTKAVILCAWLVRLVAVGAGRQKISDGRYGFSFIPANLGTYEYVNKGKQNVNAHIQQVAVLMHMHKCTCTY